LALTDLISIVKHPVPWDFELSICFKYRPALTARC